jgi:hypothetical protein
MLVVSMGVTGAWLALSITVLGGCHSAAPGGVPDDAAVGLVTQCTRDAEVCPGGQEPLCCPQAGPQAPRVICSRLCDLDADCSGLTTQPHCSRPAMSGGAQEVGLCMPAGEECCWFCR